MKIIETTLRGVVIIEPKIYYDDRGYFFESFSHKDFIEKVSDTVFVQDNESRSKYGVVRGLHFQTSPYEQAKLVRVVRGVIRDVVVDLRRDTPTFGHHISTILSEENHRQLFIPRGFAHGYAVLAEDAVFQYKCDNYYAPGYEGAILWNDPDLGIDWGLPAEKVVLSEKDRNNPSFESFVKMFS